MLEERFFEYDQVTIDASKVEEYEHDLFGPVTVFKDVVIVREIVQPYVVDGETKMAYKPANELEDAFWTAEGMWAISTGHPDTAIIMDRDQMQGRTVNVRYTKSLKDIKTKRPNNVGVVADLEVFNNKVAPEVLEDMLNGKRHDVSIGFFFNKDETPGVIDDAKHPLNGIAYDYVQRKIAINHTAFALEAGRCPMPFCGIGSDEIAMLVAGDPFAGYKNFKECVKKNKDKEDPSAYCGAIKAKTEKDHDACIKGVMAANPGYDHKQAAAICLEEMGPRDMEKVMFRTVLSHIREDISIVLSKLDGIEPLKSVEGETIVEDTMSADDLAGLLSFYTISEENWYALEESTRITLRSLWTERQAVYKNTDPTASAGGERPLEDTELTGDEVVDDCPDCEDDEEAVKQLAADLSLEEIDKKLGELKKTRDGYRDQVRKLDEELYDEPDSEKKRKSVLRKEIGELWDKIDGLYDEIRAYTQAKTLKITQTALADAAKEKKDDDTPDDEPEAKKVPFKATKEIEELIKRQF